MIDQERKKMEVASIAISPILTSRDTSSSPNNIHSSHMNDNLNVNIASPLQQQQSSDAQFPSPPQQNLRKDQYRNNIHDQYFHRQRQSYHRNILVDDNSDDNDENIDASNNISLTSFRSMQVVNLEEENGSEGNQQNDCNHVYVDEIDAPSDEREEIVYEIMNYHRGSNGQQQQEQSEQFINDDQGPEEHDDEVEQLQQYQDIENDEQRRLREEEESEALARQLMAEEAMASYAQSSNFLRSHANEYSEEDLRALQALMAEEDPMNEIEEGEEDSEDLSYETLLRLGERMGDVKSERWALKAEEEIAKLKTIKFDCRMAQGKDENDCSAKCLICQFQYEEGDSIRVLPCKHRFHHECVDQWLATKDHCPYCRQSIIE